MHLCLSLVSSSLLSMLYLISLGLFHRPSSYTRHIIILSKKKKKSGKYLKYFGRFRTCINIKLHPLNGLMDHEKREFVNNVYKWNWWWVFQLILKLCALTQENLSFHLYMFLPDLNLSLNFTSVAVAQWQSGRAVAQW